MSFGRHTFHPVSCRHYSSYVLDGLLAVSGGFLVYMITEKASKQRWCCRYEGGEAVELHMHKHMLPNDPSFRANELHLDVDL